ncbi:MAG TPA: hypothetical protein ENJ95_04010 [Bacteroidetes bacterium]|nr:hypothetical protein [Bacteroidota bacterium]
MKLITVCSIFLLLFGLACTSGSKTECAAPAPLNPNGDSELSLLMREMFDDAMRMKEQIIAGEKPEVLKRFEKIHSSEATQPEKVNTEKFKVFADSYLAALAALKNAEAGSESERKFHGMVESCMNCHRSICPGPMVRIKKLYLAQ